MTIPITTDPDGVDDSDEPLITPYPPSDPNLWDRDEWVTYVSDYIPLPEFED